MLELNGGLLLPEHFDNDYEIILNDFKKLKIELIYNLNKVKEVTLKEYIKRNL